MSSERLNDIILHLFSLSDFFACVFFCLRAKKKGEGESNPPNTIPAAWYDVRIEMKVCFDFCEIGWGDPLEVTQ